MTDLSFSIQTVAECFDEALEFRNRNRPVARDPEYYRWRYLERPCAVPAYTVWVREGEQLLGAATVAPQDFCVNGKRSCLGLVGDISVAPDARGKGVGSALLRETRTALPEGVNDVLVLPNAEAEGPLRNAGWTMLSALQRRVKLIRPRAGAGLPAALAQRTVAMLGAAGQAAVKALGPGATIRLDLDPGDWLDELWAATPGKGFAAAVRDARFVRWRFALHPLERYRIAGIFRGDVPVGYLALHTEDRVCFIDDFLLLDGRLLWVLADAAARAGGERSGLEAVQLRLNGGSLSRIAGLTGFMRRQDTQSIMLGGKLSAAGSPAQDWFFTAGDKDV